METIIFVIPAEHCYLNLPEDMVEDNPLDLEDIKEKQDEDNDLHRSLTKHPTWYSRKIINDVNDILCYTKPGNNATDWKIVLPKDLIVPTIRWYQLGATNARGVGRERRGNLRGGCMSKLYVE